MKSTACPVPNQSRLHSLKRPGDFLDCYSAPGDLAPRRAAETLVVFPWWARALVWLRGLVTSPFGLDQNGPKAADKLGPFPVLYEDGNEIIAGFDDRHLNFCISVVRADGRLHLATWVRTHNWGGRLYLAAILPFHIAIARNGIVRAAQG